MLVRTEVLKAALADPDTTLKMNLATDWHEIELILAEFARKRGLRVAEVPLPPRNVYPCGECLGIMLRK